LTNRLLCALALWAVAPQVCSATSLYDSILLAYQTNPALRSQRAQLQALDEGYVQARAKFGPQAGVQVQGSYNASRVQSAPSLFSPATDSSYQATTYSGGLTVTQPLYTSGSLSAQAHGAAANVLGGREALRQTEGELIQAVITAYVDVRRDRETISILRDEIANLTTEFAETKAKGQRGQLTRTDVAESEARLLSAQAQLNLEEGRLQVSETEYLNLVGERPGQLDQEPELPGIPKSIEQAFDAAEHNNPQLRQMIQTEVAARDRVNQAKAAFGPTVALKVDVFATPIEPYLQGQYQRGVTGSVVVNQPLFTSGVRSSLVREAVDRDNAAQLDVEFTRRKVVGLVGQAWSQLLSTQSALAIQSRQVEVERVAVQGNQVEERAGTRTTIELLNAELELANSRVELVRSRRDEYVARSSLLSAMGLLEVRFIAPGAELYDPQSALKRVEGSGAPPWVDVVAAIDRLGAANTRPPQLSAPAP
jgi:outer membrane protein